MIRCKGVRCLATGYLTPHSGYLKYSVTTEHSSSFLRCGNLNVIAVHCSFCYKPIFITRQILKIGIVHIILSIYSLIFKKHIILTLFVLLYKIDYFIYKPL